MDITKAIIFDCFGVLATEGLMPFFTKYFDQNSGLLEEAVKHSERVSASQEDYDGFVAWLSDMAHVTEQEVRDQIEHNVPDEALFAFIKQELKPQYKIGMLSNAASNWLPEIFTPEQIALFDEIVLSYQVGAAKPAPKPYQVIVEKLGFRPEECLLIDDQPRYIEGAKAVEMQAMLYRSFEEMKRELAELREA